MKQLKPNHAEEKKQNTGSQLPFFLTAHIQEEEGPNSYGLVIMGIGGGGMRGACEAPLSMEHNKL